MSYFDHPIMAEVAALELPHPHRTVIGHGAAMAIRGFRHERQGSDIDLLTDDEDNLEHLMKLGFVAIDRTVGYSSRGTAVIVPAYRDADSRFDVYKWDFSPERHKVTNRGRIGMNELISLSDQDSRTKLWVASRELLLLEMRGSGRPKDEEGVDLLLGNT